jgi:broad specificity phosphatase PhoE
LANHAGSVVGWTDSKLSIKGREQANKLFKAFYPFVDKFTAIHSSDLSRCKDTLKLSLGFTSRKIHFSENLR